MWDNILGQDVNLDCASLHPGVMGTWLLVGSTPSMFPEGTETDNVCEKFWNPNQGVNVKSSDSI